MKLSPSLSRWLLGPESDPSVRWRTLVEVLGRPSTDARVRRARREIGRVGWAAALLAEQLPSGQWATPGTSGGELYRPKYIATNWRMLVLADLGMTRQDPRIRRVVELIRRRWGGVRGDLGGTGSELCIAGNALRAFLDFGYVDDPDTEQMVRWLVATQKADGGWHCFPSRRGTLDCWEGLAALARLPQEKVTPEVKRTIDRGAEFYLQRRLHREGARRYAPWFRIHYPQHYYYDLLVGLDTLTRLGYGADRRLDPALRWLTQRRDTTGRWKLDAAQPDVPVSEGRYARTPYYPFVIEHPGLPSRWATVSALAVLRRVELARSAG